MKQLSSFTLLAIYVLSLLISLCIGFLFLSGGGLGYWDRNGNTGYSYVIPSSVGVVCLILVIVLLLIGVYFFIKKLSLIKLFGISTYTAFAYAKSVG